MRVGRIGISPAHVGRQSGCAGGGHHGRAAAERPPPGARLGNHSKSGGTKSSRAQPVRRCDAVIEEITRLRAELAGLYQRDQRLTGEWHRAHHALVDAGRGTCDASNATPDGGTRFGSECKETAARASALARRLGTPVPISARPPQVSWEVEGARIGLDRSERLAGVSRINSYCARRRLGGTAMMLSARCWVVGNQTIAMCRR